MRPRVLLIDNADSFTWNLAQQVQKLGAMCRVISQDACDIDAELRRAPDRIILSPGPGHPRAARASLEVLRRAACGGLPPVLGVCLGHQCMAEVWDGEGATVRARRPMHGRVSSILNDGTSIFSGLPSRLDVARYHSLVVRRAPPGFRVTAWTDDDAEIMAMCRDDVPIVGVQFHPESFLTLHGDAMMSTFLYDACR